MEKSYNISLELLQKKILSNKHAYFHLNSRTTLFQKLVTTGSVPIKILKSRMLLYCTFRVSNHSCTDLDEIIQQNVGGVN